MTLSPSTIRADLKCGRGAIAPGKKCHKGPARRIKPRNGSSTGPSKLVRSAQAKLERTAGNKAALTPRELEAVSAYYRAQRQRPGRRIARAVKTAASLAMAAGSIAGVVGSLSRASRDFSRASSARRRASLERAYRGPSAKRDSVYADGFTPDLDQLAI